LRTGVILHHQKQRKTLKKMTTTKWVLDPSHSEISFKVKHLMISNVKGVFAGFAIDVTTAGDDFSTSDISLSIDPATINTGNADRDAHLKSADFFDTDNFKTIAFKSEKMEKAGDDEFKLTGDLTIKGISRKVTLDVEFGGLMTDPWGNQKVGFSLNGKINRKDWGLNWNAALEAGGVLVGEEVKISAEVQFVKQA
jgi:polyisoprenoid-binding protein YceI